MLAMLCWLAKLFTLLATLEPSSVSPDLLAPGDLIGSVWLELD